MNDTHHLSDEEIFAEAMLQPTPDARAAYLKGALAGDEQRRRRIAALLAAHDHSGEFLNNPPAAVLSGTVALTTGMVAVTEKAGDKIGHYKLREQIGEGGCGLVYVAEQQEPVRRRVALKIIKLGMDTKQVVARFEAERQALALMDHPHIAKVLDAGATDTGRPYFVMELVRGIKITDYCDQNNLSTEERLKLFMQVCHAIQHAHQKGIIHRDIKPSNILVTLHDGVPVPKVIDFGIAKATSDQRLTDKTIYTAFEQFIGTPAYMSPEQAEMSGLDIDTRSDIYSLGVLLYELLTGKTPFDPQTLLRAGLDQMRRIIREQEPPKPSTRLSTLTAVDLGTVAKQRHAEPPKLVHSIRGDLDWIVMRCLEKDRIRRYPTADSLADDLGRHLSNEPVEAAAPGVLYRVNKFVRRHRLGLTTASALTLLLAGGVAAITWQALRAEAAATKLSVTLANSDFLQATRLIAEEDYAAALTYLARSVTVNPKNDAALTRLLTLLTYHSWMIPTTFIHHSNLVVSAQFSPNGKHVVTASADGTARVWDAQSGQPLGAPMAHHGSVSSAKFSPDGKWVLTISEDRTVRVWNAQSGQSMTGPIAHSNAVSSAEFSPDGKRVVTASEDGMARLWDAQSGQLLTGPMRNESLVFARFNLDGKRIIALSGSKLVPVTWTNNTSTPLPEIWQGFVCETTVRIWDAQSGEPVTGLMKYNGGFSPAQLSADGKRAVLAAFPDLSVRVWDVEHAQPITPINKIGIALNQVRLSPDGKRILTISADSVARVWDAQSGRALGEPMKHNGHLKSAQFSLNGGRILTVSESGMARVWDAESGKPLTELTKLGPRTSAHLSADGKRIVTASEDKVVLVWNAEGGHAVSACLQDDGQSRRIQCHSVEFDSDGKRIVTSSGDGMVRVWDVRSGQPLTGPMKHNSSSYSAQFSADGKRIVTAPAEGARVWDAQSGQLLTGPMMINNPSNYFNWAEFSPDGRRILTASHDGARVWDAQSGKQLTGPMKHWKTLTLWTSHAPARFSPDGTRVLTVSDDSTVRVWDAQSGQPLAGPMLHSESVNAAEFSPDGKRVATCSLDGIVRVWDAQSGQLLTKPVDLGFSVKSPQFSLDRNRVVAALMDGTASVWDVQTGQQCVEPLRHNGDVSSAQFSRDGRWILTFSTSGMRLWDARSGQPMTEPLWCSGGFPSAQISPDGKWVVTARNKSGSGTCPTRLWDFAFPAPRCPDWLPQLAEVVSGQLLNKQGVMEASSQNRAVILAQIYERLNSASQGDDWSIWGRWFLGDRSTRTISPFLRVTLSQHVHNLVRQGTADSLNEAQQLAIGNAELLQQLAEVRANSRLRLHEF